MTGKPPLIIGLLLFLQLFQESLDPGINVAQCLVLFTEIQEKSQPLEVICTTCVIDSATATICLISCN